MRMSASGLDRRSRWRSTRSCAWRLRSGRPSSPWCRARTRLRRWAWRWPATGRRTAAGWRARAARAREQWMMRLHGISSSVSSPGTQVPAASRCAEVRKQGGRGYEFAADLAVRAAWAAAPKSARLGRNGIARPFRSASCRRRTAASRRPRWRSRAAPRGCCARWDFPASANCRCRRAGAPIWWR